MKKLLFVLSLLSLIAVGCNRNEGDTQSGAGGSSSMERQNEEAMGAGDTSVQGAEEQSMQQGQQGDNMGSESMGTEENTQQP